MRGISLIMPVYHAGNRPEEIDHFREALDSVVALSLSPRMVPFELIIVDDASKNPRTKNVMNEYALHYPWIKTISNKINHGPSYARNRALDIAQYDHIAGVDADDILTNNTAKFYTLSTNALDKRPQLLCVNPQMKLFGLRDSIYPMPREFTDNQAAIFGYNPVCGVFRTQEVRAVGGWREDAPKTEDWKLAVDIMAMRWRLGKENVLITLPNTAYLYRQYDHGENVNARPIPEKELIGFLIEGNEDFYQEKFGSSNLDNVWRTKQDLFNKTKVSRVLRKVFQNFADDPLRTAYAIVRNGSQKLRNSFNVGAPNSSINKPIQHTAKNKELGLG